MTKDELLNLEVNQCGFNVHGVQYTRMNKEGIYMLSVVYKIPFINGDNGVDRFSLLSGDPTFEETREELIERGDKNRF